MKRKLFLAVCFCGLLALPGCGRQETVEDQTETVTEQSAEPEVSAEEETPSEDPSSENITLETGEETAGQNPEEPDETQISLFEEMPENFVFSSGAGGWSTELKVEDDGTFTGAYHDSEMGITGENYPNGTVYICNFSGSFSDPVQTDDDTWSVKIDSLQTEGTEGEEYYEDGVRYIYAEPFGLTGTDELQIFPMGTPVDQIPEGFLSWTGMYFDPETEDNLPFYGIYNAAEECAFISME